MNQHFNILRALLQKELLMFRRNPLLPRIVLVMPLMVMLIFPLVANLDVTGINVAVVDNDKSILSRRVSADMASTETFTIVYNGSSPSEAMGLVADGSADVVLTIPRGFEATLSTPYIRSNGVNALKGMLGSQYVASSVASTMKTASPHAVGNGGDSIVDLYLFNPSLSFRDYMIPALMVVLIIIICGFLPALNIVSEKETGTIEAMNVTPVGRFTFILSKLLPYWIIGLLVITEGMAVAWLVYGLAPAGNIGLVYLAAVLFSLVMSGLGVTVANTSSTMLQSIFVMFACIMIFQLMGGLFTPVSSMPGWAQWITYAVPPRYFNEIMRAVYLKGACLSDLTFQFTALTVAATLLCTTAALTYNKRS